MRDDSRTCGYCSHREITVHGLILSDVRLDLRISERNNGIRLGNVRLGLNTQVWGLAHYVASSSEVR